MRARGRQRWVRFVAASAATATLSVPMAVALPPLPTVTVPGGAASYIVELVHGAPVEVLVGRRGIDPTTVFEHVLTGFAAELTPAQLSALRGERSVVRVTPNVRHQLVRPQSSSLLAADPADPLGLAAVSALVQTTLDSLLALLSSPTAPPPPAQVLTNAVRRVGAAASPTARIDGSDERVDATIALIDTGIDAGHPDLNVVGGRSCIGDDPAAWHDDYVGSSPGVAPSHGTRVAGVAAALDNDIGIVGVAPGARLLAAKAVDAEGYGTTEELLCAIEWAADPAQGVDVINISLGWPGGSDDVCGVSDGDLFHGAICSAVAAGITVVVAAGNQRGDAAERRPASYPEVITVSGIADFDGQPGGHSAPTDCDTEQVDDHLRTSSNFGPSVDIAASAACVDSTLSGGGYGRIGGTSLATPAVSGAAALLLHRYGPLAPGVVRARLVDLAEPGPIPGDPDDTPEGILDVSRI